MQCENCLKGVGAVAFAAFLLTNGTAFAQNPDNPPSPDPTGEWLVAKKIARIRIVDCDQKIWGLVSWEARPGVDKNNPDKGLSTRPTLGMPILLGMTPTRPDKWEGEIYNSENGKKYDASVSLLDPDTLKVQGCVLGFLCGGENWSRVGPTDAERTAQAMPPPGSEQKLNSEQPAKRQANKPNGMAQRIRPPSKPAPAGPWGAAENGTPAVTTEMLESAPAADICSRIAGLPGLAH